MEHREIVVIGAGPAGAVAATLLRRQGHDVLMLERQLFPRFSIGESLLAHCLEFIEEAGMMDAVRAGGFQVKNGAAFARGEHYTAFDFREKFTAGPAVTYQVQRAQFDKILADDAARQGVDVRFQQEVTAFSFDRGRATLAVRDATGEMHAITAKHVLDASGYGRVLARMLDLERPSSMPARKAIFTHIEDGIVATDFDREKILISVHPDEPGIWYWLIPFSNGRCSIGVVGGEGLFSQAGEDLTITLRNLVGAAPNLRRLLVNAKWDTPANTIAGYSASVTRLHGDGFTLLGNAAEFLDPVFSSGVTIALCSAKLATDALMRELNGGTVDWDADFSAPLMAGVETFRTYVDGWYDGSFQDVVFHPDAQPDVRRMVCSILAGYAWDTTNPYVADSRKRLRTLATLCAPVRHCDTVTA